MNVWIAIARLLYCFDFEEIPGQPIDTMTIPQITKHTPPFQVKVIPRSQAHAALIRKDCEASVKAQYLNQTTNLSHFASRFHSIPR